MLFQGFQLTTLVIRGPANCGKRLIVSLDCVAIKEEEVRGVLLCVQDFFRSPHFTQRSFFSDSGSRMSSESVVIGLHQVRSVPRGVLWSQHVRAKSSLICVLVGVGLCCAIVLPKTPVSVGIKVAPLGVRQHQGQGWESQTSLRRGASKTCQLLPLLLVLLGRAKSVPPPVSGREKSLSAQWSCRGDFNFPVLQLVPRYDP